MATGAINLVLCGFGRAGNMHLTSIRHNYRCKLKYIVDLPTALNSVQQALDKYNMNDVIFVSSNEFDEVVLKDKEVSAVLVTTPTDTHEEYICKSVKAGKAVFSEKPIADNIPSIIKCYAEAEKAGVPLFCAFNRRFDDSFAKVKQQITDNKVGKLYSLKTTSRDSPLPSLSYLKMSNGMYHDCAVHDIDIICWIVGEEPSLVYAHGHAHHPDVAAINDVDTIAIVLSFPSGVIATIDLSRHSSYGYDQRLEVLGEKGMIQVTNPSSLPVVSSNGDGIHFTTYHHSFPTRYEQAYKNELDHFLDCVSDHSVKVKVSVEDVLLVTRVANACMKSHQTNKAEPLE